MGNVYQRKPEKIEAWQWLLVNNPGPYWLFDAYDAWPGDGGILAQPDHEEGPRLLIITPGGLRAALPGDYIIRDSEGRLKPCGPETFFELYEPTEP